MKNKTKDNKKISFSITRFKLKPFGLKDIALFLFIMVIFFFFDILTGFWGFVIKTFLMCLTLIFIDLAIEKEVNDWLASKDVKVTIKVEDENE